MSDFEHLPPELVAEIAGFLPPADRLRLRLVNSQGAGAVDPARANRELGEARRRFARLLVLCDRYVPGCRPQLEGAMPELVEAIYACLNSNGEEKQTAIDETFRKVLRISGIKKSAQKSNLRLALENAGVGRVSDDAYERSSARNYCVVQ